MDALTFLYWALGVGFVVLVVFLCVTLYQIIRVLRDVADTTSSVRDVAETVSDSVENVAKKVDHATDQLSDYIIKPLSSAQYFLEKVKPVIDIVAEKSEAFHREMEEDGRKKKTKRKSGKK